MDYRGTRIQKKAIDKKKRRMIFLSLIRTFAKLYAIQSAQETGQSSYQLLRLVDDNVNSANVDLTCQEPTLNVYYFNPASCSTKPLQTESLHQCVELVEPAIVDPMAQIPQIQRFFEPVPEPFAEQPQTELLGQEDLINELIHIDTMLYMQSNIASMNYTNNPEHLLDMIASQHLGLDNLLKRLGVEMHCSQVGEEFNPELMLADSNFISTDDEHLHGCIAKSVTPLFLRIGNDSREKRVLQYEHVMLYAKNE